MKEGSIQKLQSREGILGALELMGNSNTSNKAILEFVEKVIVNVDSIVIYIYPSDDLGNKKEVPLLSAIENNGTSINGARGGT